MARRPKTVEQNDNQTAELIKAFVTLESFGVTQDDPVSTTDFALEMGVTDAEAFNLLDKLADAELVDAAGRGLTAEWWINVPDVSSENAESIAREGLNASVSVVETPKRARRTKAEIEADKAEYSARTSYSAAVSASQEEGAQHLHPMMDTRPVVKAVEPIKGADGENVTVPVSEGSTERRELDASQGERVISEETITVKVTPKPERLPEIDGLDQFIDDETGDMVYESRLLKAGLILDTPEAVPPCPDGVNPNMWDHAHTAHTQSGRDWALRQIVESLGITREAFDLMLNAA